MNSEKVKESKKALEERTQHKPINCCNAEYVEACGMYCRHHREFVADMGSKNGQTCENCSAFIATDKVNEYVEILTLINELESENERLNKALVDNLEAYKDGFSEGADLKTKAENKLKSENHQLKDRIAELEMENDQLKVDLKNSIDMQEQMLGGFKTATKEVEENLASEIPDLLKQFAER